MTTTSTAPKPQRAKTRALSPYENDPAVKAMRLWTYQAGRAINAGKVDTPELDATMTSTFRNRMQHILGEDVGSYYPGPLPLQPVGVTVVAADQRIVKVCDVTEGWAQDKSTHKPMHTRKIAAATVPVVLLDGVWLVNELQSSPVAFCKGVKVATPTW